MSDASSEHDHNDNDAADASDAEDDTDPAGKAMDDDVPLTYHQLPSVVHEELAWTHNAKHVIELAPSSNGFAAKFLSTGGSYFGLCATDYMKELLIEDTRSRLLKMAKNPNFTFGSHLRTPLLAAGDGDTPGGGAGVAAKSSAKRRRTKPAVAVPPPPAGTDGTGPLDIGALLAAAKSKLSKKGRVGGAPGLADADDGADDAGDDAGEQDE